MTGMTQSIHPPGDETKWWVAHIVINHDQTVASVFLGDIQIAKLRVIEAAGGATAILTGLDNGEAHFMALYEEEL